MHNLTLIFYFLEINVQLDSKPHRVIQSEVEGVRKQIILWNLTIEY